MESKQCCVLVLAPPTASVLLCGISLSTCVDSENRAAASHQQSSLSYIPRAHPLDGGLSLRCMGLQGSPISEVRGITGSLFKELGFLSLAWKGHPFLRPEHRTTGRAPFLHVASQSSNPSTPDGYTLEPFISPRSKS